MDKKKILVVEDEKAIADILVFNLQREGYSTMVAYDGTEGLRAALLGEIDLVPDEEGQDRIELAVGVLLAGIVLFQ